METWVDQARRELVETLVSSKSLSLFLVLGHFSGGLEYIVISSGLQRNEGLKSYLVMDLFPNELGMGKRLNKAHACKVPLSQKSIEILNLCLNLSLKVVTGEGFFQEIQAPKQGIGTDLSINSGKERFCGPSLGFLVLENEGFQCFGSQDAGKWFRNIVPKAVGQHIEPGIFLTRNRLVEEWLGLLFVEENHVPEGRPFLGKTKNDRITDSKRKKGKVIRKKTVCPNLVLKVDIQIYKAMEASELILARREKWKH